MHRYTVELLLRAISAAMSAGVAPEVAGVLHARIAWVKALEDMSSNKVNFRKITSAYTQI